MSPRELDHTGSFVVPLIESSISLQVISMNTLANFNNKIPA